MTASHELEIFPINELETTVNAEVTRMLDGVDSRFTVTDYTSREPIDPMFELEFSMLGFTPTFDQSATIDLQFALPATDPYGNIDNVLIKLGDGLSVLYVSTKNFPLLMLSDGDHVLGDVEISHIDSLPNILEALGIDASITAETDPYEAIANAVTYFAKGTSRILIVKEKQIPLHKNSCLKITHRVSTTGRAETSESPDTNELSLEVIHFESPVEDMPSARVLNIPTAFPRSSTRIRFRRDVEKKMWVYDTTYKGSVDPGLLPDEYLFEYDLTRPIQPGIKLIAQILEGLQQDTFDSDD